MKNARRVWLGRLCISLILLSSLFTMLFFNRPFRSTHKALAFAREGMLYFFWNLILFSLIAWASSFILLNRFRLSRTKLQTVTNLAPFLLIVSVPVLSILFIPDIRIKFYSVTIENVIFSSLVVIWASLVFKRSVFIINLWDDEIEKLKSHSIRLKLKFTGFYLQVVMPDFIDLSHTRITKRLSRTSPKFLTQDFEFDAYFRLNDLSTHTFVFLNPSRRAELIELAKTTPFKIEGARIYIPLSHFRADKQQIRETLLRFHELSQFQDLDYLEHVERTIRGKAESSSLILNMIDLIDDKAIKESAIESLWRSSEWTERLGIIEHFESLERRRDEYHKITFRRDAPDYARAHALKQLIQMGKPKHELIVFLEDPSSELRMIALEALDEVHFCLLEALIEQMDPWGRRDRDIERLMIKMIRRSYRPALLPLIKRSIEHEDESTRLNVIHLLSQHDHSVRALKEALLFTSNPIERQVIQIAIAQIRERLPRSEGALALVGEGGQLSHVEHEGDLSLSTHAGGLSEASEG